MISCFVPCRIWASHLGPSGYLARCCVLCLRWPVPGLCWKQLFGRPRLASLLCFCKLCGLKPSTTPCLHLGIKHVVYVREPSWTPLHTLCLLLHVGWLSLMPRCTRGKFKLCSWKQSSKHLQRVLLSALLCGGIQGDWPSFCAKELSLLRAPHLSAGRGCANPSLPPSQYAGPQGNTEHRIKQFCQHRLPPRVKSLEQLGRKKKDKKLADLTTSFLPSFQKLKHGACLSAWENHGLHVALISLI